MAAVVAEEWDEEYGQIPYYARGFALQRVPVSQIASPFINPIRQERIDELAELEDEGYELPPVILDGPGEVEEVDYPEEKYPFLDGHSPVVGEDVWYVHDGHHRVTLAVQRGQRFIDALIIGTSNEMKQNGASPLDNPAFRRWFGDSKVVDEEGQPLVVYHGTRADFDVFKRPATPGMDRFGPGFYFSADPTTLRAFHGDSGRKIAAYLRIERPTRGEMTADQIRRFFSAIKTTRFPNGYDAKEDHRRLMQQCLADPSRAFLSLAESAAFKVYFTEEDVMRGMAAAGIDGVIVPVHGHDEYVVFDPRQIKSATDNVGTFDPDDPSILRNPDVYPDAFVIVHLSSLGSLAFEAGRDAADRLLSDLWLEAREATRLGRQVIVIDQGWEGRVENRARREIMEAAPNAIWVHHDEDEDGWDDFESSFPKLLRKAGIGSAKVGGLWFDGCLDHVSKIMSAAGVKTLADPELSVSYCDIGSEEGDEDDE
jgi:hypothetical protein